MEPHIKPGELEPIDIYDPSITGAKGLVYIGDKILVYRRDTNTADSPLMLDLPGGGVEAGETPFEAFKREVYEEFGLDIKREDIVYSRSYPNAPPANADTAGYFLVAELPEASGRNIVFGDEGVECILLPPDEYLGHADALRMFQERTSDYIMHRLSRAVIALV